jgi:hypothetical protein
MFAALSHEAVEPPPRQLIMHALKGRKHTSERFLGYAIYHSIAFVHAGLVPVEVFGRALVEHETRHDLRAEVGAMHMEREKVSKDP